MLFTHVGWLGLMAHSKRGEVNHAANYNRGQYGWDYKTLCGKRLKKGENGGDVVEFSDKIEVTCAKCLKAIRAAERKATTTNGKQTNLLGNYRVLLRVPCVPDSVAY